MRTVVRLLPLLVCLTVSAGWLAAQVAAGQGGTVRGMVKDGNIPLPGVSVTAANSLTGQKYSTTTDITGRYALVIPRNGRYVLSAELSAFARVTKEVLLHAPSSVQTVDFSLVLASRAQQQREGESLASLARQYGGAQSLNLLGAAANLIQAGGAGGVAGASLPSLAANPEFSSGESVAVSGQMGTTNPFAGIDFSQMREDAQLNRSLSGSGPEGGGFGGRGGFRGGHAGGGMMRGSFRKFKPNQPHGALFWNGGNGALNAADFALRGQPIQEPAYATNRFGATLITAPWLPVLLTRDRNDMIFFTISGTRSTQPFDQYGTVPTAAERNGDFSALTTQSGMPITLYDPGCGANDPNKGKPFPGNVVTAYCRLAPQATALLRYMPLPNLTGSAENYQRLTSAENNQTRIGLRFMHTFGSAAQGSPVLRMVRQFLGQGSPGLTQSMNVNFNYQGASADELNLFPQLGGKSEIDQYSLQLGYTIAKGRMVNHLTAGWNQTHTQVSNSFSNTTDVASSLGLAGLSSAPSLWGLPSVTLNQFSAMNELQPKFELQKTISLGEMSSWMHGKHNLRLGADVRRVFQNEIGNTNSTGTYIFSGLFTEKPGSSGTSGVGNTGTSGIAQSGSSMADFLLGVPQETTLQADYQEAHLRQDAIDWFAQDDWRAMKNTTLLIGLRYEYFSPYSERNDRLATLDTGDNFTRVATVTPNSVGPFTGKYPHDLIYPEWNNFSPRLGIAVHPWRNTVIRGGYGINYTVGQYAKFVQNFAFEPPFANVQTNVATSGAAITLANGFPSPQAEGNYAVNKNYRLPYVQVWNVNVQRSLPWQVVLNVGYNGSKGSRLDIVDAPGRNATTSLSGVFYDYEDSLAFSSYNALTVSGNRRISGGIALRATYTWSHAIDDASSIGGNGGTGTQIAQNWQNLLAEESNSSFDIRQRVVGSFVYELPVGPNAHLLTAGWMGHALANVNISGDYEFATGTPLTPAYEATVQDVARGTTNSLRPDRVWSQPLTEGGGRLNNWFNKEAFVAPAGVYGTASRLSVPGPGTVSVDMSASKSLRFGDTRTFEMRATANNVFNTVQYSGVDSTLGSATYGEVISTALMRQFTFMGRFRF